MIASTVVSGCHLDPIYSHVDVEHVPAVTDGANALPPPPPLPTPLAPQELTELHGTVPLEELRPGDALSIEVREEPELSVQKVRIDREGMLRLPWLGVLQTHGKTRTELKEMLEERLRRTFVRNPEVTVDLLTSECRRVYVLGRVAHPGVISLPPDQPLTLVQLIALAGDFSTAKSDLEADPTAIRLIRTVNGQKKTFRISFETIVEREQLDKDIVIQPDDVIYVPAKRELHIFGSVLRPGSFALADGSRLSIDEALSLAGGFAATADRTHLTLIRRDASGAARSYYVDVRDERARTGTQVTASDTLIVSDQQTRRVFVIGNVGHPGAYDFDEKGLSVIKCLAIAGGLNRIADGDAVRLLRSTPEGRKIYRVPVNSLIRNNDLDNDPVLIPGDIIYVPESFF